MLEGRQTFFMESFAGEKKDYVLTEEIFHQVIRSIIYPTETSQQNKDCQKSFLDVELCCKKIEKKFSLNDRMLKFPCKLLLEYYTIV